MKYQILPPPLIIFLADSCFRVNNVLTVKWSQGVLLGLVFILISNTVKDFVFLSFQKLVLCPAVANYSYTKLITATKQKKTKHIYYIIFYNYIHW